MNKKGFTLSEVLITLAIIGVIAAITIPSLMNNTNGEERRAALKKAISGLNQALNLNYALTGLTAQDYTSSEELVSEVFNKRMSVIEGKDTFTSDVCDGSVFTSADGIIFCVKDFYSENGDSSDAPCNMYNTAPCIQSDAPNIWIDVNGERKPNQVTTDAENPRDIYQAQIYAQKVVPYGVPTQAVMYNLSGSEVEEDNDGDNNSSAEPENPTNPENPETPDVEPENPEPENPDNPDVEPENPENPDIEPENPDNNDDDYTPPEDPFDFWNWVREMLKKLGEAFRKWLQNYIGG